MRQPLKIAALSHFLLFLFLSSLFANSEKKIKILSAGGPGTALRSLVTKDFLDFCKDKGVEVISQTYRLAYWNQNHVIYQMPPDLSVNQLPKLDTVAKGKLLSQSNGFKVFDNYSFQYPATNFDFVAEFAKYLGSEDRENAVRPQPITIDLRQIKSPSGKDINIASFQISDSFPNKFWFISGVQQTEVEYRGRRTFFYETMNIHGGLDAQFIMLKKIRDETALPTLIVSPGNLLGLGEKRQVPLAEILLEIAKLNYSAINVDFTEIELLHHYATQGLETLGSFLQQKLPIVSVNLFYTPQFYRQLVANGIIKENVSIPEPSEKNEKKAGEKSDAKTAPLVFPPYLIKEIDGLKIGFLGVTDFEAINEYPEIRNQFVVSNDIELINERVKELRKKADLVVMLGQMLAESTRNIAFSTNGVDIFVGLNNPLPNIRKEIVYLKDEPEVWSNKLPIIINTANRKITEIQLVLEGRERSILKTIETSTVSLDQKTAIRDEETSWPYWQHLFPYFQSAEEDYLLPDAKEVFKYSQDTDEKHKDLRFLRNHHFWSFVASTLAQLTDSEIGFFPVARLSSNSIGPIKEIYVKEWLAEKGNIVTFELSGNELIGLIKKVKTTEQFSPHKYVLTGLDQALEADYESEADLALSQYTLHQKPIIPSEKYSVVTSDKLLEKTALVPEFKNATHIQRWFSLEEDVIKPTHNENAALSLQKAIVDYLKFSRELQKKEIKDLLLDELPEKLIRLSETQEPLLREKMELLSKEIESNVASKINERTNRTLLDLFEGRNKRTGPYTLINFKKLGFTFMKTDIENNENFGEVQNSRITTYDTTTIGFSSDVYFEMHDQRYSLTVGNKTDFSQTTFFIPETDAIENISKDLTVSYAEIFGNSWDWESPSWGLHAGPFYELAYETQLKEPEDIVRKNSVIMILGPKISEGTILSEAKAGAIADFDYSAAVDNQEYGFYASVSLSIPLLTGSASWDNASEFKYFLESAQDDASDLGIEWTVDSELVLPFLSLFYLVPFANFLLFTGKVNGETGYGLDFGVSFKFSRYFKPQFQRFLNL
jgi:2',3'-cyclic-nucleotide 2'-phosphodiesterase (5'-nucleotidase family)